ncbi:MAG: FMN-binding protein [Clostridia bacterium]|nr:FMN-binding protein [Clostridia bacterium]
MKKSFKNTFVLGCICAVVSVILAFTNALTAPIIEKNESEKANAALSEVLPSGKSFTKLDITGQKLPSTVKEAYRAENGGYVLKLSTTGYAPGMVLMCGISPDGTVAGTKLIASGETPSIGGVAAESFAEKVLGKDASGIDGVDTVGGATKTTAAYRSAVKDALNAAILLGGGDVDIRTEEEILRDNLSAALPSAGGEFEKLFITEDIAGVDDVYKAKNETGFVCVIGEQFIALDMNGEVLSDTTDEIASVARAAMQLLLSTQTTDLTLTDYVGLPTQLISAKVTATGNYIIEIKGIGYGILGGNDYHPASGEYIVIRVSMTADGRIIDCLTVSQGETNGIGSACANESFYGQFDGKTEANYGDIEAIGGATVTTNGYKQAILRAFESVKIFEKGANQ